MFFNEYPKFFFSKSKCAILTRNSREPSARELDNTAKVDVDGAGVWIDPSDRVSQCSESSSPTTGVIRGT